VARITLRLRPTAGWGAKIADHTSGSNHIRYLCSDMTLRLSTDAPVSHILEERTFRLEKPIAMFLGADEGFDADDRRDLRADAARDRGILEGLGARPGRSRWNGRRR
jgi:hypothetical protein